jgi:Flp pilus assembly protein TadG
MSDDGPERGGATGVEMALLWIALLALILAVVQVALVFYAGQLALTAAQDGLRSGRSFEAPAAAATRDAESFLARAAGSALVDSAVTATTDEATGTVRVTVSGYALSVLPGFRLPVSRDAVGGLERITP